MNRNSVILEAKNIVSGYETGFDVIRGVSMVVFTGEIVAIIGPNGCGKSTLFKTLFGILKTREGEIEFQGERIDHLSPVKRLQKGITFVPQGRANFPFMSVKENLEMGAFAQVGTDIKERIKGLYETFPILQEKQHQQARTLSSGQQQILEIAMRLVHDPKVALIDEPSLGLDPQRSDQVFDVLKTINDQGVTLVLVEQNAVRTLQCSDRAYVLEQGQNRYEGTAQEILHSEEVKQLYLGG